MAITRCSNCWGSGAFLMGVSPPANLHWASAAFLGFLVGGLLGGVLRGSRAGRIVLTVIGVGFVALILIAIVLAERG